jgi:general secretion pathway protein I
VRREQIARADRASATSIAARNAHHGFTLLEVMIAVAFIGIAMLALLSLHQSNLESVIRAQDLTRASMLAQQLISMAEANRFPLPGQTRGDFSHDYPGEYKNFYWERDVDVLRQFPDVRRVRVSIIYGRRRRFDLVEFMHNPTPPQPPGLNGQRNQDAADSQGDSAP